jgi:formate hydrogenlyase transcriptional activator
VRTYGWRRNQGYLTKKSDHAKLCPDLTSRLDPGAISAGPEEGRAVDSEAVLNILQLILAGSPLPEVLSIIARLVESHGNGTLCTIWLPDEEGKQLFCAAAPSLPGFISSAGSMLIGPKGGSCGTAVYRREPVYVSDILQDPVWDVYRHRLVPFGIRSVWSRPLFMSDGKLLGTFAVHYREVRSPEPADLRLIENASHIAGIAIERNLNEVKLRQERDRLRLLLEITNSTKSKLDLGHLLEALSTNLLGVTRSDFCALLLPHADSGHLQVNVLYNPGSRGFIREGAIIPIKGSTCGKAFVTGKNQLIDTLEDQRTESSGNQEAWRFFEQVTAEGLKSGCELPLLGRKGVVGVLAAFSRAERAFSKDEFSFLDQVAQQVASAVENALDFEKAKEDRAIEAKQRVYFENEIKAEFAAIVGDSPALNAALHMVSVVAPTASSVLILGETGTGKELIARAIHNLSGRKERAFVKLNCAAIPLGLLESELFGHEKGAFTGAVAQKTGRFELAHKGTLFLDEVGDISLELQAKLLRVLQEQEFERLGSNRTHKVDVRLIAATHRDLAAMVKQSTFREDLYYRLKVFPINVPPLRQRAEDIPKLVRHFTELYARRMNKRIDEIPSESMTALVGYRWPGNVRELQNFIERAVILSPHTVLRAPTSELEALHAHKLPNLPITSLKEIERDHIVHALAASDWVVGGPNGAAKRLGMKRTSLIYKMRKLRISRPVSLQKGTAESVETDATRLV